ncbi:hypothetical protein AAHC03_022616 [Spirometra sp. Aus1]
MKECICAYISLLFCAITQAKSTETNGYKRKPPLDAILAGQLCAPECLFNRNSRRDVCEQREQTDRFDSSLSSQLLRNHQLSSSFNNGHDKHISLNLDQTCPSGCAAASKQSILIGHA